VEDAPSQQAMAEEFAAAADEAGAEEATEDKAAFPVFGSMWRLRNRRLAEEFAAAADEAGVDKAKEDKAAVPVFGSMWRLLNRRLVEEFAAAADEAGADKAKEDKAGRRRRRRRHVPVFGSMWVRHAEHGLVRCSRGLPPATTSHECATE
jgi:hypothetical protein